MVNLNTSTNMLHVKESSAFVAIIMCMFIIDGLGLGRSLVVVSTTLPLISCYMYHITT